MEEIQSDLIDYRNPKMQPKMKDDRRSLMMLCNLSPAQQDDQQSTARKGRN